MHGSLLPKYRGRAPVNWAVLHGERETGATLHYMTEKPDDGDIVAQTAVPILPDDTAREVFDKVTVAAETDARRRRCRRCVAGTAPRTPQDLPRGSYFGGRTPEDGIIDWTRDARDDPQPRARRRAAVPRRVHRRCRRCRRASCARASPMPPRHRRCAAPRSKSRGERLVAHCGGGGTLDVLALEIDGATVAPAALRRAIRARAPVPSARPSRHERREPRQPDARPARPRQEPRSRRSPTASSPSR